MAGQLLDCLGGQSFIRRGEREGAAFLAGAAGAADPVHIVFRVMRHVEVEHMAQPADIDAARGHIGTAQQAQLAGLELLQRREAHRLRHVAMQRAHAEAMLLQRLVENVDIDLAIAEDQRVLHILAADQPAQRLALVQLTHQQHALGNRGRHRGRLGDGDLLRVLQERIGQPTNFRRHGGGEEQRLPVGRQLGDDLLHIRDEAHVQHPVGLVDHQHAGIGQQNAATLEHVDQPAGRGNQHVHATHQQVLLVGHAFAADHQRVRQFQILAVFDEIFRHLQRQFARRLQNQAARHTGAGAAAVQNVQHRQSKSGGLAGAGLCATQHVAAHQHIRDGLFLDRRRVGVALLGDRPQNRLGQPERCEAGGQRFRLVIVIVRHFRVVVFIRFRRRGGFGRHRCDGSFRHDGRGRRGGFRNGQGNLRLGLCVGQTIGASRSGSKRRRGRGVRARWVHPNGKSTNASRSRA